MTLSLAAMQRAGLLELPTPGVRRWTRLRKLGVVTAVAMDQLSIAAACERYDLSAEELRDWGRRLIAHGPAGLDACRLQELGR